MIEWIKNNSTAVVWMLAATVVGFLLPTAEASAVPTTLEHFGGALVGLLTSAYLSLYLYNGPSGLSALKRMVPALVAAAAVAGIWYAGVVIPVFILPGVYAGCVTLFVAAVFARIKSGN